VRAAAQSARVGVSCIGTIDAEPGLRGVDAAGRSLPMPLRGFDHFVA
jgi:thiamine-monophosphate kinase